MTRQKVVRAYSEFLGLGRRLGSHEAPTRSNVASREPLPEKVQGISLGTLRINRKTGTVLNPSDVDATGFGI